MIEWKSKFRPTTLEKGKKIFENGRVEDIEQDDALYTGAVLEKQRYEVSAVIRGGKLQRANCHCPMARGGSYCEHMAALLYAIDELEQPDEESSEAETQGARRQKITGKRGKTETAKQDEQQKKEEEERRLAEEQRYSLLHRREDEEEGAEESDGDGSAEEEQASLAEQDQSIERLEKYQYFELPKIKASMDIPRKTWRLAEHIVADGKIQITNMKPAYERRTQKAIGIAEGVYRENNTEFPVELYFSQTELLETNCMCPNCRKSYYAWYRETSKCAYVAALFLAMEKYLEKSYLTDATDMMGQRLMAAYNRKNAKSHRGKQEDAGAGNVNLVPRLTMKDQKLYVSFKVGSNKMFVVKKLGEFCSQVREGADAPYGTSVTINHSIGNFTEKGQRWIRYINRIVQEEEQFTERLEESGYNLPKKFSVGGNLELFGWRLDSFYDRIQDESVEYEDKTIGTRKKKGTVTCAQGNPKIAVEIKRVGDAKNPEGISVEGTMPIIFYGMDRAYYVEDSHIYRTDAGFLQKVEPLAEMAKGGTFRFQLGRNTMSSFYHTTLPQLREFAEIREENSEELQKLIAPEAKFVFYLDARDENVVCAVRVCYGSHQTSLTRAHLDAEGEAAPEKYRDGYAEQQVLEEIYPFMPYYDAKDDVLHCDKDENLIYRMMSEGVYALMNLGEVRCTDQFRSRHVIKQVKVSVGVSVSRGLLNLDVTTDDVSGKELLEILKSYRVKKKYHRLKSGEFVNLDDPSLAMLEELTSGLQLSAKEFAKGKMHIPMYRTLYLDQLLEEHEDVYSDRDRHFREIVKGFKTVRDADYEEPESLSKIMRKYQKDGFKWLKTLEAWKFGGILADDMGLGKTLQMIAVLLSAKIEGKNEPSLVVTPAALVYNWGEELARFAPQLRTVLVTGSQEERRKKLEDYRAADVLITSYDLLKRDIDQYEDKEFLYQVIDEAQYIKNHTTAAAKSVKVIKSKMRYALTGTPIENRLSELWSIFDYLMPGFLYGYDVFRRELELPIVKNGDEDAMKRLQKMVSPFILRRLKQDVLKDLPEKLEETRFVRLDGEQQKLYDGQVVHMRERLAAQDDSEFNQNKLQILAELTRLRQICCSPSLVFENYKGDSAKVDACLQLVQSAMDGGHRMLLFSQFTSMLEILQGQLDEHGIPYFVITGATPKKRRLELVKEFNAGDVPVFLISLKAGGVGLNLTGADVVIHYDPWWNQAVQNQATDRAHRIGQEKKVTVYKILAKGTIEEKIQQLQEAKSDLADQVISGGTGQLGSMSKEDILELLQ